MNKFKVVLDDMKTEDKNKVRVVSWGFRGNATLAIQDGHSQERVVLNIEQMKELRNALNESIEHLLKDEDEILDAIEKVRESAFKCGYVSDGEIRTALGFTDMDLKETQKILARQFIG